MLYQKVGPRLTIPHTHPSTHLPISAMEAHHVVLVTGHDAVLTDGSTSGEIAREAAIEVRHGVRVLFGDSKQALALTLSQVQCDPVTVLLIPYSKRKKNFL